MAAFPSDAAGDHAVFRSLFVAYPDGLLLADPQGRIVLANPAAARILGYTVEEMMAMDVDALVPDAIRPRHAAYRETYANAPRARPMGTNIDLVARRKDGSDVMVEIALSPLQNQGVAYVVAAIRDIADYPRVQQALQRAHYSEYLARFGRLVVDTRDLRVLLDRVPAIAAEALQVDVAMIFLLEPDLRQLRVAGGVGVVAGEAVGVRIPYRPETSPGLVISEGRPLIVEDYRTEARFVVPPAYLEAGLVSAMAVPVTDRGRTIGALTVRCRRKRLFSDDEVRFLESLASLLGTTLQRAETEEALNHAQRLESVGQLTGGIAHDFNNLLTIIQGNLQILAELPPQADEAQRQELVDSAVRASRRAAELTAKLLAFSRRQVLAPSATAVGALLQSLAGMLRRTLDQHIVIDLRLPVPDLMVLADPGQLESALLNIAINARDAMPDGGTLRFSAEACAALPAAVRGDLDHPASPDDHFVAISVCDSGSGMSDQVRERAFEPFFTTKQAGRGTGLGLSTVHGFVKQSLGGIAIDTAVGLGTTVTMYIPRPRELDAPGAESDAEDGIPDGLRVLLVEDEAEVGKVVRNFLERSGCRVATAEDARQAIEHLSAAPVDLLLTDIALGAGLRGTELAAEAQSRLPRLAVLLMSGYSAELLATERAGAPAPWELLRKPCTQQELRRAIVRALAQHAAAEAPQQG